jgi:hypothetical protein
VKKEKKNTSPGVTVVEGKSPFGGGHSTLFRKNTGKVVAIVSVMPTLECQFLSIMVLAAGSNGAAARINMKTVSEAFITPFYCKVRDDPEFRESAGILAYGPIRKSPGSNEAYVGRRSRQPGRPGYDMNQFLLKVDLPEDSSPEQQKELRSDAVTAFIGCLNRQAEEEEEEGVYNYKFAMKFVNGGEIGTIAKRPLSDRWFADVRYQGTEVVWRPVLVILAHSVGRFPLQNLFPEALEAVVDVPSVLSNPDCPHAQSLMKYFCGQSDKDFFVAAKKWYDTIKAKEAAAGTAFTFPEDETFDLT